MKWLKKWSFLIIMTGMGALYLSLAGGWRIYAGPVAAAGGICDKIVAVLEERGFAWNADGRTDGEAGSADGRTDGEAGSADDRTDGEAGSADGRTDGEAGSADGRTDGEAGSADGRTDEEAGSADDRTDGEPGSTDGRTDGETGSADDRTDGEAGSTDGRTDGQAGEPEFVTVEDDYFADAVFIGDSRTVGMYEYGGLEEISTFYASTGLTIYKLFDSRIVSVPGQKKKITVEEALQENSFQKIYLMIGINEMGTGTVETFTEKYREAVERLQELQPEAILYIQAILKVTQERSSQGDYITNEGIEARNAALSELADNVRVFYLDPNPAICDETGGMTADYTYDGVHLKAQYLELWKDFLKTHAIGQ